MLSDLGWEHLDQLNKKARAILMYKIEHGINLNRLVGIPKAPYLGTLPKRSKRIHETSVQIQYNKTDYLKHSFLYTTPVLWNFLPIEVTEVPRSEY